MSLDKPIRLRMTMVAISLALALVVGCAMPPDTWTPGMKVAVRESTELQSIKADPMLEEKLSIAEEGIRNVELPMDSQLAFNLQRALRDAYREITLASPWKDDLRYKVAKGELVRLFDLFNPDRGMPYHQDKYSSVFESLDECARLAASLRPESTAAAGLALPNEDKAIGLEGTEGFPAYGINAKGGMTK
jgi:hypothetical protein